MKLPQRQQGFVSLFTTILLSLLLIVITLSMVTLETLQLRKAEDSEQSLRAYYTAEAGVEDAVGKIMSLGTSAATAACNTNTVFDAPGSAGWTCQQISFTGKPEGVLASPDQAQTIDPYDTTGSGGQFQSVLVEFSLDANTSNICYYTFNCTAAPFGAYPATGFPNSATFNAQPKAAPVELSIVQYPHSGFNASDVCPDGANPSGGCTVRLQNAVVVPGGTAPAGGGVINYGSPLGGSASQPFQAICNTNPSGSWTLPSPWGQAADTSSTYHCAALIQNLPTSCGGGGNCDYLIRIRSHFGPSAYKLVFMKNANGSGGSVAVATGSALIDVTAKAGQTYRRVISRLPLTGQAAAGLNYLMYSDSDICKNFAVVNDNPQPGCPY